MKKKDVVKIVLFVLTISFLGCSSDDSGNGSSSGTGKWKVGSYNYSRGASSQSGIPSNNGQLFIIVCSTSGPGNLGEYSGSAISCKFYDRGAGEYTILDSNTFNDLVNPTEKYITLDCTIGTATSTGSVLYGVQTSTKKATLTVEENVYKISIPEEVQLNKTLQINGGIEGALMNYSFTANKIF